MPRPRRLALALGLWLCWGLGSAPGRAEPAQATGPEAQARDGLEDLMRRLAASGAVRARFHETKHLALLTQPLETEGRVYFVPPDRLARITTRPGRSSVVVHGRRVALRDETGHQLIELGPDDVARHFVDNLSVLLRGDLAALHAGYEVAYTPDAAGGWRLHLEPRSQVLRALIASIRVEGRGTELERMQVQETSGDSAVTVFSDVELGSSFAASELESLFSLEAPPAAP